MNSKEMSNALQNINAIKLSFSALFQKSREKEMKECARRRPGMVCACGCLGLCSYAYYLFKQNNHTRLGPICILLFNCVQALASNTIPNAIECSTFVTARNSRLQILDHLWIWILYTNLYVKEFHSCGSFMHHLSASQLSVGFVLFAPFVSTIIIVQFKWV